MPVIAVVNRKGGSGKSTIATHLAAHLSADGGTVLLGDVDRQQSTKGWLRRRAAARLSRVVGWTVESTSVLRPPAGTGPVVLDTPGGLRGLDLARVVMYADAILMPVCNSAFDRESAADCYAELQALPRVASGRCKVAVVAMRIDSRTRGADTIAAWARGLGIEYLGALRETQTYVRCAEEGLTLFDLPAKEVKTDIAQWAPVLRWVDASLARDAGDAPATLGQATAAPSRHGAQPPLAGAVRPVLASAARKAPRPTVSLGERVASHLRRGATAGSGSATGGIGRLLHSLAIPSFLQRDRSA